MTHRSSWGSRARGETETPATNWRRGAERDMEALDRRPGPNGPRRTGSGPSGGRTPEGPKTDSTTESDQIGSE